jgi:Flp pilus assembly protein TadG
MIDRHKTPVSLSPERGVALPFVALILVVLLGMTALAVDLGILLGVRTEAQRTADAAALAGASVLLLNGQDEAGARDEAVAFAARNRVGGENLSIDRDADVTVDLSRGYVGVRIQRTEDNGNPVRNRFARIIGFPTSNVSAWGAAVAGAGNQVRCPLPFALVDRFWKSSRSDLSLWNDPFVRPPDIYNAGPRDGNPPPPAGRTGWSNDDVGAVWRIYPGSTTDTPTPGYFYPLALERPGGDEYRSWIQGCHRPDARFHIGQQIDIEPGAMRGPTAQGFDNVLANDNTEWSVSGECPITPGSTDCLTEDDTDRIRPILIISPAEPALSQSGRQTVTVANVAGVFVVCRGTLRAGVTPETLVRKEQCDTPPAGQAQQNPEDSGVWVRFIGIRGEIGPGSDPNSNTLVRVLRLVE